jgi:hypothetical protein
MPLNATSFKVGHKFHPPKDPTARRLGNRSNEKTLHTIEQRIFRAINRERDGALSADQLIHARNAARLGALAEDLFERAKRGRGEAPVDPLTYSTAYATLVNAQQREMELLNQ